MQFAPNVRAVLDCSEIPIQLPSCMNCRIATYSHYKSTNTAKFLVAITPSGDIMFISKAYSGKASDKQIFNDERLIEMFDSGKIYYLFLKQHKIKTRHEFCYCSRYTDAIMVDKGFGIEYELQERNIQMIRMGYLSCYRSF